MGTIRMIAAALCDKFHVIAKPFNPLTLLTKIRAVLNSPQEIGQASN
jgi:hypothetical protein